MEIQNVNIEDLVLEQKNYRTQIQQNQESAVQALIQVGEDRFWGSFKSLSEEGYTLTENVIVVETAEGKIVKEGNRRVACLKLLHGMLKVVDLPARRVVEIQSVTNDWKEQNRTVPCIVYGSSESNTVSQLVSRIHARDEPAGRKEWPAIAKTRFDKDAHGKASLALDLVEKWLRIGENLEGEEALKWGGEYSITVLKEALHRLAMRLGYATQAELVSAYPGSKQTLIERFLREIGSEVIGFKHIRDDEGFWAERFPPEASESMARAAVSEHPVPPPASAATGQRRPGNAKSSSSSNSGEPTPQQSGNQSIPASGASTKRRQRRATPVNDSRTVAKKLRGLYVRDQNREKVASLLVELKTLKADKHPLAFCFLLRSLFETSAKAYCLDHADDGLTMQKPDGSDKKMVTVFNEIIGHLDSRITDRPRKAALHGARTELNKPQGILSVTSTNQLIHNPSFSTSGSDIAVVFNNIYPLLEEMNG